MLEIIENPKNITLKYSDGKFEGNLTILLTFVVQDGYSNSKRIVSVVEFKGLYMLVALNGETKQFEPTVFWSPEVVLEVSKLINKEVI